MSYQPGRVRGRGRYLNVRISRGSDRRQDMRYSASTNPGVSTTNISKHDNNCCSDISISLDLDDDGLVFFSELKYMWNMLKKSPPVVSKLHIYFSTLENPYIQVLRLICSCQEFRNVKTKSLPMLIIEEFNIWTTMNRNSIIHLLVPQIKIDAFKVSLRQNTQTLTKVIIDAFEMRQEQELFLNIIRCLIDKKQFKEACQYATLLNLHNYFSIHEFLIPLVLQDKLFGVDEFLKDNPKHQAELIVWMDSILGNSSVKDMLADYVINLNIPELKYDKMHAKPWKKLIARLIKMFKLAPELTPNLNRRRNEGALNFLLHKRYIDNTFGDESWKEMVQEAVGDELKLKKELIYQVAHYGDLSEALRWAHFYNLEKKDWPYSVRMHEENPDGNRPQQNILQDFISWDDEVIDQAVENMDYHKLTLPRNAIFLIDDQSLFETFLNTAMKDVDIIGIDCEWKPSFGGQLNELALMQIATRKNVFILDIINIGNKCPHLWQELEKFIFNNCDILKVGFSFTGDIHMIRNALPYLNFSTKHLGVFDLCSLWKHLEKYPEVKLPFEVQKGGPSLSTLVQHCLGSPLDKSEQFSNWEKRPLRESQIIYAALDAYCLIQCYDVVRKCCEKVNFPFEDTCYQLMTNEKMTKKRNKRSASKKKTSTSTVEELVQPPGPHQEPVPAENIKVVCDSMLQGLGKKLRSCGIDTAILENNQDHTACVKYAIDDHRYILTKGPEIYKMLHGYVPQGHCLGIESDNVEEQIKEVIDYYKVVVTKKNVFSRCQNCNGNCFVKISKSTMNTLAQVGNLCPPPACLYEDEATGFSSDDDDYYDDLTPTTNASFGRKWDLYPDEKIDVGLRQTRFGVKIQIDAVPKPLLEKYDFFYVCEECGKVYWDGSHFDKVVAGRLQGIVQ